MARENSTITLLRHRAQRKGRGKAELAKELVEKAVEKQQQANSR